MINLAKKALITILFIEKIMITNNYCYYINVFLEKHTLKLL